MSILRLAIRLSGYTVGGANDISPCPVCGAPKRHTKSNDSRGAVSVTPDGLGWHCWQCERGGNAHDFLSYAHMRDSSNVPADLRTAMQLQPHTATVHQLKRYPYPKMEVVNQFWKNCKEPNQKQVDYLSKRFKRNLSDTNLYPYCRELWVNNVAPFWLKGWAQTGHDLVFSLYDARGQRRSVIGRRTEPGGVKSKAPPRMARSGLALLTIRKTSPLGIIVEGELDWLAWSLFAEQRPNVVGIFSGAWRLDFANNFTHIHNWFVATDNDTKGRAYAKEVLETFKQVGRKCQILDPSGRTQRTL